MHTLPMNLREAMSTVKTPLVVVRAMQLKLGIILPSDLDILIDATLCNHGPRLMQWAQMFISLAVIPPRHSGPPRGRVFLFDGDCLHGVEILKGAEAKLGAEARLIDA